MFLNKILRSFYRFIVLKKVGYRGKKVQIGKKIVFKNPQNIHLGDNAAIGTFCHLLAGENDRSISIGNDTTIHPFCFLKSKNGYIHIGNNCTLNPNCFISGPGGVQIGKNVRIATQCQIIAFQHRFERLDLPICEQGTTASGITIEDDVWIGANSTVLDGVKIGKNSIVAADAVVTKNVGPYKIAGRGARTNNKRQKGIRLKRSF